MYELRGRSILPYLSKWGISALTKKGKGDFTQQYGSVLLLWEISIKTTKKKK